MQSRFRPPQTPLVSKSVNLHLKWSSPAASIMVVDSWMLQHQLPTVMNWTVYSSYSLCSNSIASQVKKCWSVGSIFWEYILVKYLDISYNMYLYICMIVHLLIYCREMLVCWQQLFLGRCRPQLNIVWYIFVFMYICICIFIYLYIC